MSDSKFLAALQAAGIQGTVRQNIIEALKADLASDTPTQRHVPLRDQIVRAQANSGDSAETKILARAVAQFGVEVREGKVDCSALDASPKFRRQSPDSRIQVKANLSRLNLLRSYKQEAVE
jgi:hypothetical protein